jgi:hypothetical protein
MSIFIALAVIHVSIAILKTARDASRKVFVNIASLDITLTLTPNSVSGYIIRCNRDCLSCHDGGKGCSSYPINHLSVKKEIILVKKDQSPHYALTGMLMGVVNEGPKVALSEMKVTFICLKECPQTHDDVKFKTEFVDGNCRFFNKG